MGTVEGVVTRLKEPSTWAALAAGLGTLGVSIPPGVWQDVVFAGVGLSTVLGVGFREGWKKALENGDLVRAVDSGIKAAEAGHGK